VTPDFSLPEASHPRVRRADLPPGPRGALWQTVRYARNPLAFYLDGTARHGDVFTAPSVLGPVVVLSHPADLRTLFSLPPSAFERWSVGMVEPLLGSSSVLLTSGETHLAQRRMIAPAFHREALDALIARIDWVAADHARSWPVATSFDIKDRLVDLAIDVIARAVFGIEDPARIAQLSDAIRDTLGAMGPTMMFARIVAPWLAVFGPYARFLAAREALDRLVYAEIDAPSARGGILAILGAARDEAGRGFTREELRDQLVTLVFAGHETSAIGLAWAMYWLHRHPRALATLRDELATAGGEVARLPYLDAVCRETLRLHPTVPEVIRKLKAPLTLRNVTLPTGVAVAACIAATHHREDLYPDPTAFRPERFLERRYAAHEFLPFGGGVHRCGGEALAWTEMKTIIARLLGDCSFSLASPRAISPRLRSITMEPRGRISVTMERLGE
jgi:cytochrome P450 family 110